MIVGSTILLSKDTLHRSTKYGTYGTHFSWQLHTIYILLIGIIFSDLKSTTAKDEYSTFSKYYCCTRVLTESEQRQIQPGCGKWTGWRGSARPRATAPNFSGANGERNKNKKYFPCSADHEKNWRRYLPGWSILCCKSWSYLQTGSSFASSRHSARDQTIAGWHRTTVPWIKITGCESIETTLRTGRLFRMSVGRLPKRIVFGDL